jgi:hypothetical protein
MHERKNCDKVSCDFVGKMNRGAAVFLYELEGEAAVQWQPNGFRSQNMKKCDNKMAECNTH